MQFKRQSPNKRCNTRRCGHIVGCVICLLLTAVALLLFSIQRQSLHNEAAKKQQAALQNQRIAQQQAQLEQQQQRIAAEQKQQEIEDAELAKKEQEEKERVRNLQEEQEDEYQDLKEELLKLEEKIVSIAKVVDGEEANVELSSSTLPEKMNGITNEMQLQQVKDLVDEAEAKIVSLNAVFAQ